MSRWAMAFSGSTTAYALLGLLRLRPWTTYELAKQVQRSLHWFWPRAERKLYDEPKLLAAAGMATATVEATGKRPRTVYTITEAGAEALASWLSEPPEPRGLEFAAMVKVFFADAGTLTQLHDTLDRIEAESLERVQALASMARQSLEDFAFPERLHLSALTMRLQLEQELAVLHWARWARTETGEWEATGNPGGWDAADSLRQLLSLVEGIAPDVAS
ncbi:MAG TPA: PadR family transcriptional regulator [Propionicimonas sp.]|uniref:PadR family transcriptional regulator n=1 Tax=Propionicimonas sp. TaxID=1955623 RepID=UPI002F42FCA3